MHDFHSPILDPVLYLDFDGVLHPDEVYRYKGRLVLKYDGLELFEWAPLLVGLLAPYPAIRVVLSTSWVRVLSFSEARDWLPLELSARVIGATWHSRMDKDWWLGLSRYQQVTLHARRHKIKRWIALDDDTQHWPEDDREQLVHTEPLLGLAAPAATEQLREKLRLLHLGGLVG